MTRGPISDVDATLGMPLSVMGNVPGMFLDDALYVALCTAFDDLFAPILMAIDCLPSYLDPQLAPADFLPWLGGLVGSSADRDEIAGAVAGYGLRGTAAGLRRAAATAAGVPLRSVEIEDPGGASWSTVPGLAENRRAVNAAVTIKIVAAAGSNPAAVSAAVTSALEPSWPVHCAMRIEVVAP